MHNLKLGNAGCSLEGTSSGNPVNMMIDQLMHSTAIEHSPHDMQSDQYQQGIYIDDSVI